MKHIRLVKIYSPHFDSEFLELCEVSFDGSGDPDSISKPLFCTKREFREAYKSAMNNPVILHLYDNGRFIFNKRTLFWNWQKNITEDELYAVYGGD